MNDDAAVIWWNPAEQSNQVEGRPAGAYCYLNKGQRWGYGERTAGRQDLFTGECR